MGRFPTHHILTASYSSELAEKWGRRVRNIVDEPTFRANYGVGLSADSKSAGRWANDRGGEFYAAGVGGGILGFRADCLVGDTLVQTETGYTAISDIAVGDSILAYDTTKLSTGFHRVLAKLERRADVTYRIHTSDGGLVEATGNHPFYVGGVFVPAASLAVGDTLLRSLSDTQS